MIDFDKYGFGNSEDEYQEEVPYVTSDYDPHESSSPRKIPGKANIVVLGIGGGGNNAVNNMVRAGIKSASFLVMNTDVQALNMALVDEGCKIQIGSEKTGGLGAGSNPEVGKMAAEESREAIQKALEGIDLLFITAGMGGGTGTGAAPVVADIAKSIGILTVAVVTKPFNFEGAPRMANAEAGIRNLRNFVDTLLIIPNQKLLEVLDKKISFKRAFEIADDVLRQGVQGVSDVIANPAHINLDFADVKAVLKKRGLAHMGIGYGKGEKRVIDAVRNAVYSPLLETDIEGATGVVLYIAGGEDMMLSEVNEACEIIKQVVAPSANIIFGTSFSPEKKDIEITIIATGFIDKHSFQSPSPSASAFGGGRNVSAVLTDSRPDLKSGSARSEYNKEMFADRPVFRHPALNENTTSIEEKSETRIEEGEGGRRVPKFLNHIHRSRE